MKQNSALNRDCDCIKDDLPRSVLLLGMHLEQNQYSKYLREKWLHVEHVEGSSTIKKYPSCDVLLVARDQLKHSTFYDCRDFYKDRDRPVFLAKDGMSATRKVFEEVVFGPGVIEQLQSLDMPYDLKIAYCLTRFHKPGDIISQKEFKARFADFIDLAIDEHPRNGLGNFFYKLRKPSMRILSAHDLRNKSNTKYIYHGLQGHFVDQLIELNIWIPKEESIPWNDEVESDGQEELELVQPKKSHGWTAPLLEEIVEVPQLMPEEETFVEESMAAEDEIAIEIEAERTQDPIVEQILVQRKDEVGEEKKRSEHMDELFFDQLHENTSRIHHLGEKVDALLLAVEALSETIRKQPVVDSGHANVAEVLKTETQKIKLEFIEREESLLSKLETKLDSTMSIHKEIFALSPHLKKLKPGQLNGFNNVLKGLLDMLQDDAPEYEPAEAVDRSRPH